MIPYTAEVYAHVLPAVRLLAAEVAEGNSLDTGATLEATVHARLWPYVTHAVQEIQNPSSAPAPAAQKQDGRSKVWQVVVHFWADGMTVAATDPEKMQGTGKLPGIIEQYATEMHPDDTTFPSVLVASAIKEQRLPQLRNNLGRYEKAQLRFEYVIEGVNYACVVDVAKLDA
jgi:hypothetical protein